MSMDEERDCAGIIEAAAGPVDVVLDLLPPAATPAQVRAAALSARPYSRVVLMGGVRDELPSTRTKRARRPSESEGAPLRAMMMNAFKP